VPTTGALVRSNPTGASSRQRPRQWGARLGPKRGAQTSTSSGNERVDIKHCRSTLRRGVCRIIYEIDNAERLVIVYSTEHHATVYWPR